MISEMSLVKIVGLKSQRDELFDTLSKTGATQIKKCGEYSFAVPSAIESDESVASRIFDAQRAIEFVTYARETLGDKNLPHIIKDGFGVGIDEFLSQKDRLGQTLEIVLKINSLKDEYDELKSRVAKVDEATRGYSDYICVEKPFDYYSSTKRTAVRLGIIPSDKVTALTEAVNEIGGVVDVIGGEGAKCVVCAVVLKEFEVALDAALTKVSFTKCPYGGEMTAKEYSARLADEKNALEKEAKGKLESAVALIEKVKDIKMYVDYLGFTEEKKFAAADCVETGETFLAEAYVPSEAVDRVHDALIEKTDALYFESEVVARDQFAPTLMNNGKVVRNFEAVTNMYTAPAYGALDPNGVMAFFFSLFMGVIMGDAGYGIMMIIGGFLFASKQREGTGLYRMAKVFAYGGFFAVLFGTLFDSFLGLSILRKVSPTYAEFYLKYVDPVAAKVTLAGITVPSALMWCLGLGTLQIAVSLIMKAVQCFKRGQIAEGIFSGVVWSLALVSFILTVFFAASGNSLFGIFVYPTIGLFAVGVLTAGITERGFKKVTGAFGALYGLINYVSDILSYARLYGLMLAGAQIAAIFSDSIAVQMLFPLGVVGKIAGVLVIVLGNVFNLAMSLLSAYIHDSRLQYVEFFGRFYEGEGELFTPLGSQREFVYFK